MVQVRNKIITQIEKKLSESLIFLCRNGLDILLYIVSKDFKDFGSDTFYLTIVMEIMYMHLHMHDWRKKKKRQKSNHGENYI